MLMVTRAPILTNAILSRRLLYTARVIRLRHPSWVGSFSYAW